MTNDDKQRLFRNFRANAPPALSSIRQFESVSGIRLPVDYTEFLSHANGGEGFIGPHAYAILWRVEELIELNKAYRVAEYAPGLFAFGSDGGGEAFAFDRRSDAMPVVSVPFVGMELSLARPVAVNFRSFLEHLFRS